MTSRQSQLREELEGYRNLHALVRDEQVRSVLAQLIEEAEAKLARASRASVRASGERAGKSLP